LVQGEIGVGEARKAAFAAHAAAREVDDDAAIAAAIARVFGHGIHASTYWVKVIAYATHFDAIAVANERIWQYQHLLDLGKTNKVDTVKIHHD
jgi:hypothetical protein